MAISTKWRFQISIPKNDRIKALWLSRNYPTIGDWMRAVIGREIASQFSGRQSKEFTEFAEKNADALLLECYPKPDATQADDDSIISS